MAETKRTAVAPPNRQFEVHWGDDSDVEQLFIDEMFCQLVNERAYITFGQARFPIQPDPENPTPTVEIRPTVKLIINQEKLAKIAEVLSTLVKKHTGGQK